jgi:WD40 repeat protein
MLRGTEGTGAADFDGHELLGEIARGGMGVVYRARQLEPERLVALKSLRSTSLDSPEAKVRFKNEAEVMVALDHAAILPVYRCGEADGIPFFTMKLVEGGTLAGRINAYSGQWRGIAELMAQVCDAVRHAHERGVLHRDLKPSNILFDSAGHAYVSDFGIAKLADSQDAVLTLTLAMMGTPHYFAPEVAAGGASAASVSSDVWSLGVILYELLTGEKPFRGESVTQVVRALELEEATLPRKLRADVPRDLEVITLKALAREPARRYASAQALAEDLRAWLEGRPITARAVPAHERAWLWARRNPGLAGMAALFVLALIAAAASLVWGFVRVKEENVRVLASQANERARLRESLFNQARASREAHDMGWRAAGLKALREAYAIRPGDDVRDEAIAHLAGFDLELGGRQFNLDVRPSVPSMDFYVRAEVGHRFSVHRMQDGKELFRSPPFSNLGALDTVFDPRGRWLAVSVAQESRVYSMGDFRELARWPEALVQPASEDGEYLPVREKDRWVLRRTADWSVAGEVRRDRVDYLRSRFQPGGQLLFTARLSRGLSVMDWRTGSVLRSIDLTGNPGSFDWVGDYLAAVFRNDLGQAYDLRRGRSVMLPQLPNPARFYGSTNSVFMLSSGYEYVTQLWHLPTGKQLAKGRGFMVRELGRDDRRFITVGPAKSIEGTVVHPSCVRLLPERQMVYALLTTSKPIGLSPDGRLLLIHDRDRLAIHDIATGRLLAHRVPRSMILCAAFSPEGQELWVVHALGISVLKLMREDAKLVLTPDHEVPLPAEGKIHDSLVIPGGRGVLIKMDDGQVFDWRIGDLAWRTRGELKQAPSPGYSANLFAISGDGRWIGGNVVGAPIVYEPGNKPICHRLGPPLQPLQSERCGRVSFSPDSKRLIYVDRRYQWEVYDGPEWRQIASSDNLADVGVSYPYGMNLEAAWSPDASWFAALCDGTDIQLVECGTWRIMARLHGPLEIPVDSLHITGDGSCLVVQRRDLPVEIWYLRKLEQEMHVLGIDLRLPPPVPHPTSPPGLEGPIEELVLPPLIIQGAPGAK